MNLYIHPTLEDPARTRGIDPGASVGSGVGRLQLNILTEGDDIEVYLTTFERLMLGIVSRRNGGATGWQRV